MFEYASKNFIRRSQTFVPAAVVVFLVRKGVGTIKELFGEKFGNSRQRRLLELEAMCMCVCVCNTRTHLDVHMARGRP